MPAIVLAHLDGGFTRVKLLVPGTDPGGVDYPLWEIPTDCFPIELRGLGSRVMIHHTAMRPEENDTADTIRAHTRDFALEPLSHTDEEKLNEASTRFHVRPVNRAKPTGESV